MDMPIFNHAASWLQTPLPHHANAITVIVLKTLELRKEDSFQWKHDFFTPHPQGRANNPIQNLRAQNCPYTATQINQAYGEKSPVFLLHILINDLKSVSPDMVPDLKGMVWQGQMWPSTT